MSNADLHNVRTSLRQIYSLPDDNAFDAILSSLGTADDKSRRRAPLPALASIRSAFAPRKGR